MDMLTYQAATKLCGACLMTYEFLFAMDMPTYGVLIGDSFL